LFGVSVSNLDVPFFLPLEAGFHGWALGKGRIISGETVASFLRLVDGADPSGRDWEAACRSEVEDSFWADPVGTGLSDTYDERKSSSEKNILIQRTNATCGKATQDITVYEGQRKCSAYHLSYFIY
jgi:hypothetical protein